MDEFKVMEMTVPRISEIVGGVMILWGVVIYIITDMSSLTSLIPSGIGLPILAAGFLVKKYPEKKALFMHISSTFGLLAMLGGLMAFKGIMEGDWSMSTISQLFLLIAGSIYTIICVKSFIHARASRNSQ